jgi:benzodiazapine receptor
MNTTQIIKLLVSLLLTLGVGTFSGIYTASAIPDWYASLNRPSFNPPNWVFGPVWTILYILLGVTFFQIWNLAPSPERNLAITVFLIQLLFNFCWSFIFFYFRLIGLALVDIIILWGSIIILLILVYKIKPLAAYLNIPYLIWVTFAMALNLGYYLLNKKAA